MGNNNDYVYINCDDYDSLEQACQSNSMLKVTLKNGELLIGTAQELRFKHKIEYLMLNVNNATCEVRLDQIASFGNEQLGTINIELA